MGRRLSDRRLPRRHSRRKMSDGSATKRTSGSAPRSLKLYRFRVPSPSCLMADANFVGVFTTQWHLTGVLCQPRPRTAFRVKYRKPNLFDPIVPSLPLVVKYEFQQVNANSRSRIIFHPSAAVRALSYNKSMPYSRSEHRGKDVYARKHATKGDTYLSMCICMYIQV